MRILEVMRAVQRAPRSRFPFLISPELEARATQGIAGRQPDDRQEDAVGAFFAGLLPVMDELEGVRRLLLETGEQEWQRGITILYEKLLDHCAASGLRPSALAGEPFDPQLHEALAAVEAPGVREGCVSEVVQQGWRFRDKVLRFAGVVVAKNGEPHQAE